jgi:hypothetical protein
MIRFSVLAHAYRTVYLCTKKMKYETGISEEIAEFVGFWVSPGAGYPTGTEYVIDGERFLLFNNCLKNKKQWI